MVISVIVPCRNEVRTIGGLLDDIGRQKITGLMVVVADGMSEDGTWELLQQRSAAGTDPFHLIPVRNADRTIPHALNRAVEAAPEGIIVRLDAHGRISEGFLAGIVAAIGERRDLLVGPRICMVPGAPGVVAAVIASVLGTAIGTGGTASRGALATSRQVDHTVMSCWHRAVWEGNGGFDESLLSNEDFCFDWLSSRRGCTVLSLPAPEYRLEARSTLVGLARQRWRYGWWKAVVLRRHPSSLHLRQLVPPCALIVGVGMSVTFPLSTLILVASWVSLVWLLVLPRVHRSKSAPLLATAMLAPLVAAIVQFVWATGLLLGVIANRPGRPRPGARVLALARQPTTT